MILDGKLFFYSETGTEGGYWAFQDGRFIKKSLPTFGVTNDTKVWDAGEASVFGMASNAQPNLNDQWVSIPDPIWHDPDFELSSLFRGERLGDTAADERLMKRYDFRITYHGDGGRTPSTEPARPYGVPYGGVTRVTVKWSNGKFGGSQNVRYVTNRNPGSEWNARP